MKFKRNVIVLIISMFLVSAGYTMVIPFLPLYLSELGVPEEQLTLWTGLVFSSCFFVAALMGPIWGKLADTSGKKKMAVRAGILLGFSYLFCGLCQNEYHLLAARAFQGFANGFVAAAMAIISVSVQSSEIGVTLGAAQTALVIGGICGPLLGGALSEFIGMRGSFFVSAAFLWIVSLAVIFFVHEPALKGEESTDREKTSIKDDISYALKNGIACNFVPASGNNPDDTACHLFMGQKVNGGQRQCRACFRIYYEQRRIGRCFDHSPLGQVRPKPRILCCHVHYALLCRGDYDCTVDSKFNHRIRYLSVPGGMFCHWD